MSSKLMFNSIINKLEELNDLVPEQRFGQILYNYLTSGYVNNDTFYVEDKNILDLLSTEVEEIKSHTRVRQIISLDQQIQELKAEKKMLEVGLTDTEKQQYKKYYVNEVM